MHLFLTSLLFLADEMTQSEGATYNFGSQFVNMLLTLAFVLCLIFASVWLLKKIMRSRLQTLNHSNGIKILERRSLNQKASLYLVDILGKGVVIAESSAGIHLITEFSPDVNVEELLKNLQGTQRESPSFSAVLAKTVQKLKKVSPVTSTQATSNDIVD